MTSFIICNEVQRDHIIANTPRLFPISLENGIDWVLPLACLTEPELADWHDYLVALPQRDVEPNEFPPDDTI